MRETPKPRISAYMASCLADGLQETKLHSVFGGGYREVKSRQTRFMEIFSSVGGRPVSPEVIVARFVELLISGEWVTPWLDIGNI